MNITNRLKRLEQQAGSGSEFCACFPQGSETWRQDLTIDSKYTEPILMSKPIRDFCEKCRKPVEKNRIIICFGDLEHPLQKPPLYKPK
jgi:hypothetical protein